MTARATLVFPLALAAAVLLSRPGSAHAQTAGPDVGDTLLPLIVTSQPDDHRMPWRKQSPSIRQGYGIAVGDSLVLTTEQLVRDRTLVEVRRAAAARRVPVQVIEADIQANLALLRVDDPGFAGRLKPIAFDTRYPAPGQPLRVLQFDSSDNLQDGSASVIRLAVQSLPQAPGSFLAPTVLTEINVSSPATPAMSDGRLAGLFMSYEADTRTGLLIPAPLLARFVEDATHPPYRGIGSAGFLWAPLLDPAKRRYLGAPPDGPGILVTHPFAASPAGAVLRPSDIMVTWDGYQVDNQGYYTDPDAGRVLFHHLITGRRRPGDDVPVTVIRKGRELGLQLTLTRRRDTDSLIPEGIDSGPPAYLIEGGLVIHELTGNYLRAHGGDWAMRSDTRLVHLYYTRAPDGDGAGTRILILSNVLPDPINVGYHDLQNEVILALNGQPVRHMDDVFRIRDRDGAITRLTLQGHGIDVVLDPDTVEEANARVRALYRIQDLSRRPTGAP